MKKFNEMTEEEMFERMLEIFEASVRATHDFYTEEDIERHLSMVRNSLSCPCHYFCIDKENGNIVGFVSLIGRYIDMLYVHPDYFSMGYGRELLDIALNEFVFLSKIHVRWKCIREEGLWLKGEWKRVKKTSLARFYICEWRILR